MAARAALLIGITVFFVSGVLVMICFIIDDVDGTGFFSITTSPRVHCWISSPAIDSSLSESRTKDTLFLFVSGFSLFDLSIDSTTFDLLSDI